MSGMFFGVNTFNQNIDTWDEKLLSLKDMTCMFKELLPLIKILVLGMKRYQK